MHRWTARGIVIVAAVLAASATARAQTPEIEATLAAIRADRAAVAARSLLASVRTTAVLTVLDNASRFDLVRPQTIVHEAHGVYHRDPQLGVHMRFVAARGTAPLAGLARGPIENYRGIGETVEIGDERIILLNTSFVSPLASDAGEYYAFASDGTAQREGAAVEVIRVTPLRERRPLFVGRLFVRRGASGRAQLVAMELRPSESTAIPFITELALSQSFTRGADGMPLPDSLAISGRGVVRFAALGLAETHVDFTLTSRLGDHRVGASMPDSLLLQNAPIVVRDDASSLPDAYWASRSSLGAEQIAAIETSRATWVDPARSLTFSFGGMLDYNRAGGLTPTLSAGAAFGPVGLNVSGGYSFGLERPVGEGSLAVTVGEQSSLLATVRGGAFSSITPTTTGDRSYPRIMNTLVAATLHQDYYDFYRRDGWNAGAELGYGKLRLGATYERARQFSIGNNARWSLLTWRSKEFPENPPITEGAYTTLQGDLAYARVAPFLKLTPLGEDDIRVAITGLRGERAGSDTTFELVEALASWSIPIIETGYVPMTLTLLGAAGTGSATLPPQYQFRLRTSAATFGKPGGFVSPPKGRYGGTEYVALGAELNLTDLPWRALGLPTHNGRGVELIVAGGAARYRQEHPYGYEGTGGLWYSEAGIGLSRIPLFLTDIVYGRVDLRRGFGPLGRFGGNFTFVLPI